jgi:hypothetical protein
MGVLSDSRVSRLGLVLTEVKTKSAVLALPYRLAGRLALAGQLA